MSKPYSIFGRKSFIDSQREYYGPPRPPDILPKISGYETTTLQDYSNLLNVPVETTDDRPIVSWFTKLRSGRNSLPAYYDPSAKTVVINDSPNERITDVGRHEMAHSLQALPMKKNPLSWLEPGDDHFRNLWDMQEFQFGQQRAQKEREFAQHPPPDWLRESTLDYELNGKPWETDAEIMAGYNLLPLMQMDGPELRRLDATNTDSLAAAFRDAYNSPARDKALDALKKTRTAAYASGILGRRGQHQAPYSEPMLDWAKQKNLRFLPPFVKMDRSSTAVNTPLITPK